MNLTLSLSGVSEEDEVLLEEDEVIVTTDELFEGGSGVHGLISLSNEKSYSSDKDLTFLTCM